MPSVNLRLQATGLFIKISGLIDLILGFHCSRHPSVGEDTISYQVIPIDQVLSLDFLPKGY